MRYTNSILERKTSFQLNAFSPISKHLTIEEILRLIKSNYIQNEVNKLRQLYLCENKENYSAEKLQLPAITFCGSFDVERKKDKLLTYNSLVVIDIDKLSSEQISEYEEKLSKDKYVFSYWRSPSNFGIKGLVNLNYNFEIKDIDHAHKSAFYKLYNYFEVTHNIELDKSGNDTTRLCFLSYDLNLVIKDQFDDFQIEEADLKENKLVSTKIAVKTKLYDKSKNNALYNPSKRNSGIDKREMKDIINYLTKSKTVITGDYDTRYKIAYSISNTFTFEIGKLFFLSLCQIEQDKYNENKELKLLEYCYENNAGFIKFDFIKNLVKEKYNYKQKTLEKRVQ
ncbi:BT4734/BF3469 family protein [Cytophaga aurantiaca]|uniref:BT4734/BF3469 family protein n=1 Tax=Cytophaga aurantiaca TaxID=29530 RepID=UPI00037C3CEF|nr:BT4734/BF3469 family protein [Cytophaga aurantiaca]